MSFEAPGSWDELADVYDQRHGDEGNDWHRLLVEPAVLALLGDVRGKRILDLGCGTGVLARRLLREGAHVVGVDGSDAFLERARRRPGAESIEWGVVDVLDEEAIASRGAFDAVVCTMVLMDVAEVGPLFRGARHLLTAGPLVVVTAHPCFNHPDVVFWAEAGEDGSGEAWTRRGLKLAAYGAPYRRAVFGMPGQPVPQWYFHRPLQELLGPAFEAGLVLDALQEPTFPSEAESRYGPELPPVLALRLVPA